MKYCVKCKKMQKEDSGVCSYCQGMVAEITEPNTPVHLITADGFELQRIRTALEDNGIPCDAVATDSKIGGYAVKGYDNAEYSLLVPYSAYEKAYDICVGIGAIKDGEEKIIVDDEMPQEIKEMSPKKRTTLKVLSALAFLLLVALAVWGTDYITGFIKGLFG